MSLLVPKKICLQNRKCEAMMSVCRVKERSNVMQQIPLDLRRGEAEATIFTFLEPVFQGSMCYHSSVAR